MIQLTPIKAFNDNYIWAMSNGQHCAVVDPGQAQPVLDFLAEQQLILSAILITHHHADHTGGISAITAQHAVPVYGPANEAIPGRTHAMHEGDQVHIESLDVTLQVTEVPGHTAGHIAYYSDAGNLSALFPGDTLFSGGCGRLFEGTPQQMLASLDKLAALPDNLQLCCAHEYTLANLAFSQAVLPADEAIANHLTWAQAQRRHNHPTLPTRLGTEKRFNLFLRSDDLALQEALSSRTPEPTTRCDYFAALRAWKDTF